MNGWLLLYPRPCAVRPQLVLFFACIIHRALDLIKLSDLVRHIKRCQNCLQAKHLLFQLFKCNFPNCTFPLKILNNHKYSSAYVRFPYDMRGLAEKFQLSQQNAEWTLIYMNN